MFSTGHSGTRPIPYRYGLPHPSSSGDTRQIQTDSRPVIRACNILTGPDLELAIEAVKKLVCNVFLSRDYHQAGYRRTSVPEVVRSGLPLFG
jgi:hypothetical protein